MSKLTDAIAKWSNPDADVDAIAQQMQMYAAPYGLTEDQLAAAVPKFGQEHLSQFNTKWTAASSYPTIAQFAVKNALTDSGKADVANTFFSSSEANADRSSGEAAGMANFNRDQAANNTAIAADNVMTQFTGGVSPGRDIQTAASRLGMTYAQAVDALKAGGYDNNNLPWNGEQNIMKALGDLQGGRYKELADSQYDATLAQQQNTAKGDFVQAEQAKGGYDFGPWTVPLLGLGAAGAFGAFGALAAGGAEAGLGFGGYGGAGGTIADFAGSGITSSIIPEAAHTLVSAAGNTLGAEIGLGATDASLGAAGAANAAAAGAGGAGAAGAGVLAGAGGGGGGAGSFSLMDGFASGLAENAGLTQAAFEAANLTGGLTATGAALGTGSDLFSSLTNALKLGQAATGVASGLNSLFGSGPGTARGADPNSANRTLAAGQLNQLLMNPGSSMGSPGTMARYNWGLNSLNKGLAKAGLGGTSAAGGPSAGGAGVAQQQFGQEFAQKAYSDQVSMLQGIITGAPGFVQNAGAANQQGWQAIGQGLGAFGSLMAPPQPGNPGRTTGNTGNTYNYYTGAEGTRLSPESLGGISTQYSGLDPYGSPDAYGQGMDFSADPSALAWGDW